MDTHNNSTKSRIKSANRYRVNFGWSTLLGVFSFGIIVPTFFIPLKFGSKEHWLSILVATITSFVIWEGSKFIQNLVSRRLPWELSISKRLFYEISSIFLFSSLTLIIGILTYDQMVSSLAITIDVVLRNVFVAFLLALLFTAINEGTFLFNNWKMSLIEQEKLKKEALEAKLESLKKQLDPHFLFNSLSVLSGVMHEDLALADLFITKLSQVYRYVIEHNEVKKVQLKKELLFVEAYFFLLNVRFQGKINLDIPRDLYDNTGYVLPLSLQLLVENAIKHNKLIKPLKLKIYQENDLIWLENNLQKREAQSTSIGIGLKNLKTRYKLKTGRTLEIIETPNIFKVGIPLIKSEQ